MSYKEGNRYKIDDKEYEFIDIGKITLERYSRILNMKYLEYINKIELDDKTYDNIKNNGFNMLNTLIKYCKKLYCGDLNKLTKEEKNIFKNNIINYYKKIIDYEYFISIKNLLQSLYFYFVVYF